MDKIILKGLVFYAYHGVLEAEKKLGQKFIIDIELKCDLKKACLSDDVKDTINYAEVYNLVKEIVETSRYNLLEKLAETCAQEILTKFTDVEEIIIKVKKTQAPVEGLFSYFATEIRRKRNG